MESMDSKLSMRYTAYSNHAIMADRHRILRIEKLFICSYTNTKVYLSWGSVGAMVEMEHRPLFGAYVEISLTIITFYIHCSNFTGQLRLKYGSGCKHQNVLGGNRNRLYNHLYIAAIVSINNCTGQ